MKKRSKKQRRHLAAVKAWKTRKNNLDKSVVGNEFAPCEYTPISFDELLFKHSDDEGCKRSLAAKKAWRTRRKNEAPAYTTIELDELLDENARVLSEKESICEVRHQAAIKAWITRRKNEK